MAGEEELDPGLKGYSDSGSDLHDLPAPELPAGVQKTVVSPTPGATLKRPQLGDEVVVHCTAARARGGALLASTRLAGEPLRFVLGEGDVLRGLALGVPTMRLGEVAAFTLSPEFSKGALPGVEEDALPRGTLVLEVELVDWVSCCDLLEDGRVIKRTVRRPDDRRRPIVGQECVLSCRLEVAGVPLHAVGAMEHTIWGPKSRAPESPISSALLDKALLSMKRGERAHLHCPAHVAFDDPAAIAGCADPDAPVLCELELLEFLETVDVSFERDGSVTKRTLHSRDAWEKCEDAGRCSLAVSVHAEGEVLVSVRTLQFTIGNGEVCDALECAAASMRKREEAVVTCSGGRRCEEPRLGLSGAGLTFRVTVADYEAGPSEAARTEEEKLEFLAARKCAGNALVEAGRYELAAHRFGRVHELLGYIDDYRGVRGGESRKKRVAELKRVCLLNRALCLLKFGNFRAALVACDMVLDEEPRNPKALFRRAQACLGLGDCPAALRDARAAAEAEPGSGEARRLLGQVQARLREDAGQTQPMYAKMCSGLGKLPHPLDVD